MPTPEQAQAELRRRAAQVELDRRARRPAFGFAPGKEMDLEGFVQRPEPTFGDSSLPKARLRDVPGIVGRGLASAELGVAKGVVGTIDAALNIPSEGVRKVGTPWAPSQFMPTREQQIEFTKGIKEAKSKIVSAQKKFDPKFSGALAWTTRTITEAVPYMANAAVAGAAFGPAGAFGVGFVVEGDYAYDEAIASGAGEEKAQRERVVVGSLNAIIEALQVGRLMKFSEGGKHSLKNFVKLARSKGLKVAGKELKGWSGEVARLSIEEALEEFSQEGVSLGIPAAFRGEYPKKEDGSPDWLAMGERLGGAALGGAVAGPILGGAGRVMTRDTTVPITPEEKITIQQTEDDLNEMVQREIPPGSNVYQTAEGRRVIETPSDIGDRASQKTELRDGLVIDKETGEELTQVTEGTVSGRLDAPKDEYNRLSEEMNKQEVGSPEWRKLAAQRDFAALDMQVRPSKKTPAELTPIQIKPERGSYSGYSVTATENSLPPVKPGFVRIFRGESPERLQTSKADIEQFGTEDVGKGGWFTTDLDYAMRFFKGKKDASLVYMDITEEQAKTHFLRETSYPAEGIGTEMEGVVDPDTLLAQEYFFPELRQAPAEATAETPAAPEQVVKPPRRSKTTLRAVGHKIARESNVNREDYEDYAEVVTSKRSMKDMTRKEMEEFIVALEESFGSPTELTQEDFETPITVAGRGTTMGSVYRDVVAATEKLASKITIPDRVKLGFAKSKTTRQLRNFAYGIDNTPVYHLARILDGATNGIFSEVFDKGIQLGTKITDSHKRSTFGILRAGLDEAGVTNDDLAKMGKAVNPRLQTDQMIRESAATEILVEKINGREFEMTWANLIDIYLMGNQKAGLKHLQEGGLVINSVETGALSDDWILDTMAKVEGNEKTKAVADAIMKVGSDIWAPSLNQVSNRLEGKDIATVANWWGLEVYMPKRLKGKQRSGISLTIQKGINLIEDKGILKDRTRSGAPLVVRDAFSRFAVFEDAVAEYVGMAEPTRTTRTLLNNPGIAKTLKQKGYDDILNNIRKIHETAQSSRPSEGGLTAFVERHLPALYRAALHANPPVIVSQATSTFNYGAYASPEFMGSIKDGLSIKLCQETLALSDVAWARFHMGQSSLELGEMAKSDAALRMWTNKSADINKLGWGLKVGDLVALTGGMSIAQQEYQKALNGELKGLSAEWWTEKNDLPEVDVEMWRKVTEEGENADPQERQAVEVWKQTVSERAEYLWQRTQPSWDKWNRSVITSQKGIARTFLLFRSFHEKCLTIINEAILDYDNSPKSLADKTLFVQKTGSVMASYTVNMVLRLAILTAMTRKIKEPIEYIQDMLTSWMGMFPVFGKVLDASTRTFIAALAGAKPTYKGEALESMPISIFNMALKTPIDFTAAVGHFIGGDNDKAETSFLKGMDDIFKGVGAIYGVPVYQIKRIMPSSSEEKTSAPTRRRVTPPVRRRP